MKTIFKFLAFSLFVLTVIPSCKDNDFEKLLAEQERLDSLKRARIDSTNKAQAPILKTYAEAHLENPTLDAESGIWFEVLEEATDDSYNFFTSTGAIYNFLLTTKYEGRLVDNEEYQEEPFGKSIATGGDNFTASGLIDAWLYALIPKKFVLNNIEYPVGGLTNSGVKKGGKIRIITPSTLAYDNVDFKDNSGNVVIPADSPLDFIIEVVDIKNQ